LDAGAFWFGGITLNNKYVTVMNKQNNHQQQAREKYESRIKQTRAYILDKNLKGQLNNQKWLAIFEWMEKHPSAFTLTTLLNTDTQHCTFIRELGDNSILIDDPGMFIVFLEIHTLTIPTSDALSIFLDELHVPYAEFDQLIEITGYR
jgi:hypothetical protein